MIKRSYLGSYQNTTRSYRLYTLERADANSNSSVDLASWKARPLTLPATRKKIDNTLNYSRLKVIGWRSISIANSILRCCSRSFGDIERWANSPARFDCA